MKSIIHQSIILIQPLRIIFLLAAFTLINAQSRTTIHILHPWANDTARVKYPPFVRTSETGWYPGEPMSAEGGTWYTYSFSRLNRTTNDRLEIASYIPDLYNDYNQPVLFSAGQQLVFLTMFRNAPADVNEVWIIPSRTGGTAQLLFAPPPGGKVIHFLNPWSMGAPRTHFEGFGYGTMSKDRRPDRCGWFSFHYYGAIDSSRLLFMNSLDSTFFGRRGFNDTTYIDVASLLAKSDSIWVYMPPAADSAVKMQSSFPNFAGECASTINLAATMRDIGQHPDFGTYRDLEADKCGGLQTGMVAKQLGTDGKPVKKAHRCTGLHSQFDWFDTKKLVGEYTNETCYNLALTTNDEGIYEFGTDSFYPVNDFFYLDPAHTIKNPNNNLTVDSVVDNRMNNHFTMELTAQFEYHKGQTFYFRGDDDVWVFIDSQLVVDLGGNHGPEQGSVQLDALSLTAGQTYNFKLFFVERNCCGSNFLMQTSINLRTSSRLISKTSTPIPGRIQIDLFERISSSSVSCNPAESDIDTVNASALFFIDGPQFTEWTKLPAGLSFGGIYISNGNNILTLDTTAMTGLETGLYTISYQLKTDPAQKGYVSFSVVKPEKPPLVRNPVVAAAFFTDSGFGQVQRAEIFYTNNLVKSPDSIVLFWPEPIGNYHRVAAGPLEIVPDLADSKHITVRLARPFDMLITKSIGTLQLGTSYIYDTTFREANDVAQFDIADSVGPLLLSALMPERTGPGDDSLFLTFTEPIADGSIIGQSLLLQKNDGTMIPLTVTSYSPNLDTIIVVISSAGVVPAYDDLLRIAPIGPLTDRIGNHAHQLNRPVPILLRKAAGRVLAASYFDRNADGIIDAAKFVFDRPVRLEECTFALSWVNGSKASGVDKTLLGYATPDSTVVIADLSTAFRPAPMIATSGSMSFQLTISGASSSQQNGSCSDSAAPVLLAAQLRPAGFMNGQSGIIPDTLQVTFSEPIPTISSTIPLILQKPGTEAPAVPILRMHSQQTSTATMLIDEPPVGDHYPADNDSVHINPAARVADPGGTAQTNPANRRVLLEVIELQPHFRIIIGPNPFDPEIEQFRIVIDPYVKTKGSTSFTVNIAIFDKVASLVRELQWPNSKPAATGAETILWNGTNRKNRYVGEGTYVAIVKIFDGSGNKLASDTPQPLKIGVLRRKGRKP